MPQLIRRFHLLDRLDWRNRPFEIDVAVDDPIRPLNQGNMPPDETGAPRYRARVDRFPSSRSVSNVMRLKFIARTQLIPSRG